MQRNINISEEEAAKQLEFARILKESLDERKAAENREFTYHIETFGCQMNAKDSEKLAGILETIGYKETDSENADIVLYNTCTVRENANNRVYGRIGFLGKLKKKKPDMKIILCGCMMQEAHVVEKIKQSYRFVDIIFGTHNIYKLAELLYESENPVNGSSGMCIEILPDADKIVENLPSARKYSFKGGVNIMYGCNNFCSYCIVPYVRGRERSRRSEDILNEIREMTANGVSEIMLLGQNVNSYGKGLEEEISFAGLLEKVCRLEGVKRVRFMTPHPKDLTDDIISVIAKEPNICNHVHLPLQSGSSRLLKLMNRHYTKEDYLALTERIKSAIPDVALTTDIIVGFPGETEEDFQETLDVIKKVRFSSAFTFIYSKRTGTPAAKMPDQVPEDIIKDRFDRLLKVISEISAELTAKDTGNIVNVLVEEPSTQKEGYVTGRLANNLLVHFEGGKELLGSYTDVRLKEAKGFYYLGERV